MKRSVGKGKGGLVLKYAAPRFATHSAVLLMAAAMPWVVFHVPVGAAPALVDVFGASGTAAPYATTYLRISSLGIPAMLVVLAATTALLILGAAAATYLPARRAAGI